MRQKSQGNRIFIGISSSSSTYFLNFVVDLFLRWRQLYASLGVHAQSDAEWAAT